MYLEIWAEIIEIDEFISKFGQGSDEILAHGNL